MTGSAGLFFDENWGLPITQAIGGLVRFRKPHLTVLHKAEFLGGLGEKDEIWIPELAKSKPHWLVVTGDQGKGKGEKLPVLCRHYGLRHILLRGKLHNRRQFDRACAVFAVWRDIEEAFASGPGARFHLQLRQKTAKLTHVG
ncbi:MAG: hypothetical protein ACOCVI_02435 [Planctomycetota bacterium]